MFDYLSSPMRWCESKFIYSIYIAEFWNSFSSLIISLIGYLGLWFHYDVNLDKTPWKILIFIGLSSFWFHFTLSFLGQFFDELGIILLVTYCIKEIYQISNIIYWNIVLILSMISWFIPSSSPFIFIISGTLLTLSTYYSIKDEESRLLWFRCIKVGLLSVFLWIMDFICIINTHTYWHIFIGYTAYLMIIYVQKNSQVKVNDYYFPKITYKK